MLAHDIVKLETQSPSRYMIFLHGVLGTRANWRSIARSLIQEHPDWGAILVDLREHGESLSQGAPHTLRAAAADVVDLEQTLAFPVEGILGHSFGGKVALEWLALRNRGAEVWLIDASPSASGAEAGSSHTAVVLQALEGLPKRWPTRQAFVSAVVETGQPEPIARWLAMNLARNEDGSQSFGPDLRAIRSLIEDYARTDAWPIIESPPAGSRIHVVIGGRSATFSPEDRLRIEALAKREPYLRVHVLESAGHWVHIDAREPLVALLTSAAGAQP